ncbi:DTWD2 [Cervus elaphus hippelaphus]|uniref:DTWD2 n=1 Tax=Cervus elaphus hippelaphus TaxID=46360 RepID=A0A212D2P4_CEREH|nr:DTWD2 [Cervus elaphus hippelaphus]
MEPHKEARTPGDPVAWLPGTLRTQTPEEEEPRVGGSAPAASVLDAEACGASADGLWDLPVEPAERRPECSHCSTRVKREAAKLTGGDVGESRRGLLSTEEEL